MENLNDSERMQNVVTERLLFFLISLIGGGVGKMGGMFRVSINCVLFNTFGETLRLTPQLFKRFLLHFKWFLYCVYCIIKLAIFTSIDNNCF